MLGWSPSPSTAPSLPAAPKVPLLFQVPAASLGIAPGSEVPSSSRLPPAPMTAPINGAMIFFFIPGKKKGKQQGREESLAQVRSSN